MDWHRAVTRVSSAGHAVGAPALKLWEGLLVGATLLLWTAVFAVGILLDSAPYREALRAWDFSSARVFLETAGMVIVTYTVPNLMVLCVLASLLGALGSHARLGPEDEKAWRDMASPYLSASIRGFFVYLAFVAGVLIIDEQVFLDPTQGVYIRTAAVMSLTAFVVSYNPGTFGALLARAAKRLQAADPRPPPPPEG